MYIFVRMESRDNNIVPFFICTQCKLCNVKKYLVHMFVLLGKYM